MSDERVDAAFQSFATAIEPQVQKRALSDLLTLKAIPKFASDPRFAQGVGRLAKTAQSDVSDESKLLALAELARSSQVVKSVQSDLRAVANNLSLSGLPRLSLLRDASDRYYVSLALKAFQGDWIASYVACAMLEEDAGEKARAQLMKVLFANVSSVSYAFAVISRAFQDIEVDTEAPYDTVARRITRTLLAARAEIVSRHIIAGQDVGRQLKAIVRRAFEKYGRPQDRKLQIDLTEQVIGAIHDLVRTRFSVSTEAETFEALRVCRLMFPGTDWPTKLRPGLEVLSGAIGEAIVLLGRQGAFNQGLIEKLELVTANRRRALSILNDIANDHSEMPENVRAWLRSGKVVAQYSSTDVLEEALLRSADASIGVAVLEESALSDMRGVSLYLSDVITSFDTRGAADVKAYLSQVEKLSLALRDVATNRGLTLVGKRGQSIEYSAKFFDAIGSIASGAVLVLQPAVARVDSSGSPAEVVIKGVVE